MPTLQQQISAKKQAIAILKDSLEIVLHPPAFTVDKSAYEPLDRIEALLKSARSEEEAKLIVESLTAEIESESQTIAELEKQLIEVEELLKPIVLEAKKLATSAHKNYESFLDAIGKLHKASNAMLEYRRLTSDVEAYPLTIGQADRNVLSNAIGFAVNEDGLVQARLDYFALGF